MKNYFISTLFTMASALTIATACDVGSPSQKAPTHPAVDPNKQANGDSSGSRDTDASCAAKGQQLGSYGYCVSKTQSCSDRGLVDDSSGTGCITKATDCKNKNQFLGADGSSCTSTDPNASGGGNTQNGGSSGGSTTSKTSSTAGSGSSSGSNSSAGNSSAGNSTSSGSGTTQDKTSSTGAGSTSGAGSAASVVLTATQNTFLVSLDSAKPNCFLAAGKKIGLSPSASKSFASNPAQITATILSTDSGCAQGVWNYFSAHLK